MSKRKMVKKIVHAIASVLPKVDRTEKLRRMKICEGCPSKMDTEEIGWTCGLYLHKEIAPPTCGCIIEEKAGLKGFNCPQKKW